MNAARVCCGVDIEKGCGFAPLYIAVRGGLGDSPQVCVGLLALLRALEMWVLSVACVDAICGFDSDTVGRRVRVRAIVIYC